MKISASGNLRIEDKWPCAIDIFESFQGGFQGLSAQVYDYRDTYVEVLRKQYMVAVFTYAYPDAERPTYWEDAEVIWTNSALLKARGES